MSGKNLIKIKMFFIIILFFLFYSRLAAFAGKKYEKVPGGINTLIKIGESQKKMQSMLKKETSAYEKIESAVKSGEIIPGKKTADISEKYGQPVVTLHDKVSGTQKWVYKPGNANYFSQQQVWLIFDNDGILQAVKFPPVSSGEDKQGT